MKIDLHVHSRNSKRPSNWLLQKLGCAESYTAPEKLYDICKQSGMDAVTITDHNTIDGCLEIEHLPDTFISCELSTYFPDDGCKLHVLAYRITEEQFRDLDRARENVFDLVGYLTEQCIPHALAHPFYPVNGRLTVEHFEQCILLFRNFELNGNQSEVVNRKLRFVLSELTPTDIECLGERHNIVPSFPEAWRKGFTGGSDDHSSLNIGHTYTEVAGARDLDEFWGGIEEKRGRVGSQKQASPLMMAHNLYGIAYQFYRTKFPLFRQHEHSVIVQFLDRMLEMRDHKEPKFMTRIYYRWRRRVNPRPPERATVTELIQYEAQKLINEDPQLKAVLDQGLMYNRDAEHCWFRFSNRISNNLLGHLGRHIVDRLVGANPFDLFHTIGSAGALYTLLAPYFVSYAIYCNNRRFGERVAERFALGLSSPARSRVGHFTDTFEEINGVALTLKKQAALAQATAKDLMIITCATDLDKEPDATGVRYFQPIGVHHLPEYPEQKLFIPPLLEMMQYCYEQNFTHIHAATPGPLGLCALAIARIMKLPFYTTYHTQIPQFARYLTKDSGIEELMWRYMLWFYDQSDIIFSPSDATSRELVEKGISAKKIRLIPRGVDTELFRPGVSANSLTLPDGPKLLYVGRVSKEKNLPLLCRVYRKLLWSHPDVNLVVVGDGPYLEEMKQTMRDTPCTFTGYLEGDALTAAYCACDVFVFPSTTDTFGNVVMEAQACGLPVIVTDIGGPCENIDPEKTGIVVKGNDEEALLSAMQVLLAGSHRRKVMGEKARAYAERRTFEQAFDDYWKLYELPNAHVSPQDGDFGEDIFQAEHWLHAINVA